MLKRCSVVAALLFFTAIGYGQTVTVHFDPAKSDVQWTLPDVLHTVHGTFKMREGNVVYDMKTGNASGLIIIDAKSGESGSNARDSKMHKEELESSKFPDISFRPQHVEGAFNPTAPSTLAVSGVFSLHGSEHPLTMNVNVQPGKDQGAATMKTEFQVPYVQWGMKDPSTFILRVGKDVKIEVNASGTLSTQ